MKAIPFSRGRRMLAAATASLLGLLSSEAAYVGADPPGCETCSTPVPGFPGGRGSTRISVAEGNLMESRHLISLRSATGPTLEFSVHYNSYDADGSRQALDSVLGYGWTHSFNEFLFNQRGSLFLMSGRGRIERFQLRAANTYSAAEGYFDTLTANPDGSYTHRTKDGTVSVYAKVPNTPFLVGGPVWRLKTTGDRNGNTTVLTYDGTGNLVRITDTYGRFLVLSYNPRKRLDGVTDPLNRTQRFIYDATGTRLVRIQDPAGQSVSYAYDFLNHITRLTDKDGRSFTVRFHNNLPVGLLDGAGAVQFQLSNTGNFAYDPAVLASQLQRRYVPAPTLRTDGLGQFWRFEYDPHGHVTRTVTPDGATTRYTYDPATLLLAQTVDPLNQTNRTTYDARGNRLKAVDAIGNVTQYTYEPVFNQITSITDPNGRVTAYQYDARGNRTGETDPLGQTRSWTYDPHGNVLLDRNKRGFTTRYTYDASGNRIAQTDAVGTLQERTTRYTYDPVGNLVQVVDAKGHTNQFVYDGLDRVIKLTNPLGHKFTQAYDREGNRVSQTDALGRTTSYVYDLRGRLVRTHDPFGRDQLDRYDANNNLTDFTDQNGHSTRYFHDVQNRLVRTVDALNQTTRTLYDAVGNVLQTIDANNHATRYTYDPLNRRLSRLDAVGNLTRWEYEAPGGCACGGGTLGSPRVSQEIDANGKLTFYQYDSLDRLVRMTRKQSDASDVPDADDATTSTSYDANNNVIAVTEPNGLTTVSTYDALDRRVRVVNAAGDTTTTVYDAAGNTVMVTSPNGNITATTYDARDRATQITDTIGLVSSMTYDAVGNLVSRTDALGHATQYTYDALDRVIATTDALGHATTTSYDGVGNVIGTIDREGRITTPGYDAVDRRITLTEAVGSPEQRTTAYAYDAAGNLLAITDARGHVSRYSYDAIDRLASEIYPDPVPNTKTYQYDGVGNRVRRVDQKGQVTTYVYNDLYFLLERDYSFGPKDVMSYDLSGRLLTAERDGWLVQYAYDGANRVVRSNQDGQTLTYAYDIPGRTRRLNYPGGRVITETTDARGRLSRVDDGGSPPIAQFGYDAANRVVSRLNRNGTLTTYAPDANDWISSLEHTRGISRLAGFGYEYDKEGDRKFEEKRHHPADSEGYAYDALHRLIDYRVGALAGATVPAPTLHTVYNLDALANWNSAVRDGVPETRTHNEANEILTINGQLLAHDDNGNLAQDPAYTYSYDAEDRLVQVTRNSDSAVVGQYFYDAQGRRISKVEAADGTASTTRYFYDGHRIIEEQDPTSASLATYTYGGRGDEVITMNRGGRTFYYHQNAPGYVHALTDEAGAVVERYAYDAFGSVTVLSPTFALLPENAWGTPHSEVKNPWLLADRQLDEETGLYFHRARSYDCLKGRFLQRDLRGYQDGMNLYAAATASAAASGCKCKKITVTKEGNSTLTHPANSGGGTDLGWKAGGSIRDRTTYAKLRFKVVVDVVGNPEDCIISQGVKASSKFANDAAPTHKPEVGGSGRSAKPGYEADRYAPDPIHPEYRVVRASQIEWIDGPGPREMVAADLPMWWKARFVCRCKGTAPEGQPTPLTLAASFEMAFKVKQNGDSVEFDGPPSDTLPATAGE